MTAELFLRGAAFGFVIAAAVGPISLLCIRRTLADGARVGLASGLGVATADAAYGAIAAFGISAISDILVGERQVLAIAGGLALVYLGVRTALSRPGATAPGDNRRGLIGAYTSNSRAHPHQPDDDPLVRRARRRPRPVRGGRRGGDAPGRGSLLRLGRVVASPHGRHVTPADARDVPASSAAQRRVGSAHRVLRPGRALDRRRPAGVTVVGSRPELAGPIEVERDVERDVDRDGQRE